MAAVELEVEDLQVFVPDIDEAKAEAMIEDALALAASVAPCILDSDFAYPGAAKAILRGAILRWNEQGTGTVTEQQAGDFRTSYDTGGPRRQLFWPSEINELRKLCGRGRAYSIDLAPDAHPGEAFIGEYDWLGT